MGLLSGSPIFVFSTITGFRNGLRGWFNYACWLILLCI